MSMYLARIVPVDHAHTAIAAPIRPRDRSRESVSAVAGVAAGVVVTRAT